MWSQPFRKRNMKIFLLDCQGFSPQQSTDQELKYAQVLLLLSNLVLFNNRTVTHGDDMGTFLRIVKETTRRVKINGDPWTVENSPLAQSIIHIPRGTTTTNESKELLKYFSDYTCTPLQDAVPPESKFGGSNLTQFSFLTTTCISEGFIRRVSTIFKTMMDSILEKSFNEINFEGSIVIRFIQLVLESINSDLEVDQGEIFNDITKVLYKSAYNFCVLMYTELLEKEFRDEEPKSLQNILNIFASVHVSAMEKYNTFNLNPAEHKHYLNLLEEHIASKEEMIMIINKKKTQNLLRAGFPKTEAKTTVEAVSHLNKFHSYRKELDHGRDEVMVDYCRHLL